VRWILALIGAVLGSVVAEEVGLVVGLSAGFVIGWLVEREQQRAKFLAARALPEARPQSFEERVSARVLELSKRVEQLERSVAELRAGASAAESLEPRAARPEQAPAEALPAAASQGSTPAYALPDTSLPSVSRREHGEQPAEPQSVEQLRVQAVAAATQAAAARQGDPVQLDEFGWPRDAAPSTGGETRARPSAATAPGPVLPPEPPSPALEAIRSFFFGGNTVVRIGVLVLTVGVGLLVKYAADDGYFPLELRLAAAALIGLALVVVGYRQRSARPSFGTALQGGGVAAMYLVTFFAYYTYQLLPAPLTMALLIAIAALSSILAVVQDAQQLAVFGAIGGFLSPVLASTGGGSHIALFSYYALLNAAISGMAVFRSWRFLNWVGFAFTFGVATAWGALKYEPANMLSASGFLGLFFLFYVLNGTLFAVRQPEQRRGAIDTTLTFGTPLATLALAGGLFRLEHLYLALSCVLIAAVYFACARWLFARRDDKLKALAAAYIAVGVGVATLAIPFALDDALATALAWAAEASGLMWVGIRQQRLRTRVASYVLFVASLLALLARQDEASAGGRALFFALIALALGFAAAQLERHGSALRKSEPALGHVLFALALLLWLGALEALIEGPVPAAYRVSCWFTACALQSLLFELVGRKVGFLSARRVAGFTLVVLLFRLLTLLPETSHPGASLGWLAFVGSLAAGYWALRQQSQADLMPGWLREAQHASGSYTLAIFTFAEARYWSEDAFALAPGWVAGACLVAPLVVVGLAIAELPRWPVAANARAYRLWSAWPIVLVMSLAALLCQLTNDGDAAPLPYVPLLNPLDLAQGLLIAALLLLARTPELAGATQRRVAAWGTALCSFVAVNGTVVRTAHHWAGVPFTPWQVPTAPLVQSAFSILWTILALLAMVVANRKLRREVWVAGAVLLGCVVIKLFLVDLSQLSNVAKIVTFLAVGVLLLLIGFVAPVPPAERAREEHA